MLKALLHRKLGRVAVGVGDVEVDTESTGWEGVTALEDPLTSTVFERFAYLPPELAWAILRIASRPLGDGPAMPALAPVGTPSWSFWPSLRPGALGSNTRRVEPDVLVSWGESVLLIEAKHRSPQDPTQWVEQIRALRADPAYAGKRMWFIAVGGFAMQDGNRYLDHLQRELAHDLPFLLTMRWEDLREVLYDLEASTQPSGKLTLLCDVSAALDAWGYRRKTWFSSLPKVAAELQIETPASVLQAWRI